jgi:hypothetical protein
LAPILPRGEVQGAVSVHFRASDVPLHPQERQLFDAVPARLCSVIEPRQQRIEAGMLLLEQSEPSIGTIVGKVAPTLPEEARAQGLAGG